MLNLVDTTIQRVLETWQAPPPRPQILFDVPDDAWQTRVRNGQGLFLNVYLYELRENRDFRRAEFDVLDVPGTVPPGGSKVLSRPPAYVDSHYLISAWSPIQAGDQASPVPDEHLALGKALQILMLNPDVEPSKLVPPVVSGVAVFDEAHIYLTVAPPEPARTLNEFWSTMKVPWRPAIQLIATAPVDLLQETDLGGVVLTVVQRFAVPPTDAGAASAEEWILTGGWVLQAADNKPIDQATVLLVDTGQAVRTDRDGRFTLSRLRRGRYQLRVTAEGKTPIQRELDVLNATVDEHVFRLA
jgi:hypothetical protein